MILFINTFLLSYSNCFDKIKIIKRFGEDNDEEKRYYNKLEQDGKCI